MHSSSYNFRTALKLVNLEMEGLKMSDKDTVEPNLLQSLLQTGTSPQHVVGILTDLFSAGIDSVNNIIFA